VLTCLSPSSQIPPRLSLEHIGADGALHPQG
jgi:hypothetical protein